MSEPTTITSTLTNLDLRIAVAMHGHDEITNGRGAELVRDVVRHALAEYVSSNLTGTELALGLGHVDDDGDPDPGSVELMVRVEVMRVAPVCTRTEESPCHP